jgi:AcrR family transcriptional regulator
MASRKAPQESLLPPAKKTRKPASTAPAKGRPRRCTWDEVLVAAERVMQREGYKSLSMRALADELGIAHPSLYTYFKHIEEVEVAVLKVIASRIPTPTGGTAAQLRVELLNLMNVAHHYALHHQGLLEAPVGSPAWVVLMGVTLRWIKALEAHTGDERRAANAHSTLLAVAKYAADIERINGTNVRELANTAIEKHFGIKRAFSKESQLNAVVEAVIDSMLPELARKKK